MLVLEPAVAVVLGSVLLGEHLSITGWEPVALVIAIAAMVAATIALGREEGAYEAELEAVVRQP
jgi:threonine/homoserine efflux transporter RhtA